MPPLDQSDTILMQMAKSRRTLKGTKGYYELLLTLSKGSLSQYHLAVIRTEAGQPSYVVVRESLPEVVKDEVLADTFLKELRTLSRFDHPNLVRIQEAAATKVSYFAIMEYLVGEGLGTVVQAAAEAGQPIPPHLAAELIAQAAEGLDHAHRVTDAKGQALHVLHRNIVPPKLVVGYDGRVKLIGFEFNQPRMNDKTSTASSEVAYASPEQCNQKPLSAVSDVFSLGVILWELLAQRPLFLRVSVQGTMQAIAASAVPQIGAGQRGGVTAELEAIAKRALQADPAARYDSAGALATALRGWLSASGHPVGPEPIATLVRTVLAERAAKKRTLLDKVLIGPIRPSDIGLMVPDQEVTAAWTSTSKRIKTEVANPAPPDTSSLPPKPAAESAPPVALEISPSPAAESDPDLDIELELAAPSSPPVEGILQEPERLTSPPPGKPVPKPRRPSKGLLIGLVLGVVLLTGAGIAIFGFDLLGSEDTPDPRPADPPPEPPKPSGKARLSIQSEPTGCPVSIDGQALPYKTPIEDMELSQEKAHTIAVTCEGHLVQSLPLTATPGERVNLAFHPNPIPPQGRLQLKTVPWVQVYQGKHLIGKTPLKDHPLPAGNHKLRLVNPKAGIDQNIWVRIKVDKLTKLYKKLK